MSTTRLEDGTLLAERPGTPGRGLDRLIEQFMPTFDVRETHEIVVHAPPGITFDAAERVDVVSLPLVRAIIALRARLMRARGEARNLPPGLMASTKSVGWVELARRPMREVAMGAAVQPWLAEPVFESIEPERFPDFMAPERVKIVWTLEAEPLDATRTRLRTETRVLATDAVARRRFGRYWMWVRIGIVLIRYVALRAIRREAERRANAAA